MDEQAVRAIVRDELTRTRASGWGPLGASLLSALEAFAGDELTTAGLAVLAGVAKEKIGRREQALAGWLLRAGGWEPRRRGGGARERVYVRLRKAA